MGSCRLEGKTGLNIWAADDTVMSTKLVRAVCLITPVMAVGFDGITGKLLTLVLSALGRKLRRDLTMCFEENVFFTPWEICWLALLRKLVGLQLRFWRTSSSACWIRRKNFLSKSLPPASSGTFPVMVPAWKTTSLDFALTYQQLMQSSA